MTQRRFDMEITSRCHMDSRAVPRLVRNGGTTLKRRWRIYTKKEIVNGLIERDPAAAGALHDRLGKTVNQYVWRLLGADGEHDDIVNQIFVNALTSIDRLKDPNALDDWIVGITINTIRREIRNRKYRRSLFFSGTSQQEAQDRSDTENQVLLNRVFGILRSMETEEHIAFVLRFVEGNTLKEVATKGGYSPATAKRRVARAKKAFLKRAEKDPFLASFIAKIGWGERRSAV